jgi:hypothetical protein
MSNKEWKLKCLEDQVNALGNAAILEEWLEKINNIPVKPGEAGFFTNFIVIPSTFQIDKEMHVNVRKIKPNKDYSLKLPVGELQNKFKDLVEQMDLSKAEQKEITKQFNKQNENLSQLDEKISDIGKYLDSLIEISTDVRLKTKEEKFLKELKKIHDGLVDCLGVKEVDFLSISGKEEAIGLIDLQQRYQEDFISKVDPT